MLYGKGMCEVAGPVFPLQVCKPCSAAAAVSPSLCNYRAGCCLKPRCCGRPAHCRLGQENLCTCSVAEGACGWEQATCFSRILQEGEEEFVRVSWKDVTMSCQWMGLISPLSASTLSLADPHWRGWMHSTQSSYKMLLSLYNLSFENESTWE